MGVDDLPEELGKSLVRFEGDYHDNTFGEYHPSHVSGCPLGAFLDFMLEKEVPMNNHIFNGTCVHYYLQETGILKEALHNSGFHWVDTDFEVGRKMKVAPGVNLVGRADILCNDGDNQWVIDIKYSSLKTHYNSGRLFKYSTQVNTYCGMFGGDKWGILIPFSKADHLPDEIDLMTNEFNQEHWEKTKKKTKNIHAALDEYGFDEGERWTKEQLKQQGKSFWEDVMEFFNEDNVPYYEGELKYSNRDEWVLPYTNEWRAEKEGGLSHFRGGAD